MSRAYKAIDFNYDIEALEIYETLTGDDILFSNSDIKKFRKEFVYVGLKNRGEYDDFVKEIRKLKPVTFLEAFGVAVREYYKSCGIDMDEAEELTAEAEGKKRAVNMEMVL